MTYQEKLKILDETREQITLLREGKATQNTRTKLGQSMPIIMDIVAQTKTGKTLTLYPPPIVGGPSLNVNPLEMLYNVPYGTEYEVRGCALDIINATIGVLKAHPERFSDECRVDSGIWAIMHPTIISVSQPRFNSGWYADAVEAAFKEINARVKNMYVSKGLPEKDGADLMFSAFPKNAPNIYLSDLSNRSEQDVQEGYMHMFAGAMLGIRNPKAHANESISQEDALRKLAFASMLMYKLDNAIV